MKKLNQYEAMKKTLRGPALILAGIFLGSFTVVTTIAGEGEAKVVVEASGEAGTPPMPPPTPLPPGQQQHVFIRTVDSDGSKAGNKETTWLGVGVEESSEALAAQLDLKPGEGLVVTYVSTNSPAAAAGLKKNDVLVELDGQMLVDSTQLRKLLQMHTAGDSVNIVFYHAGKKQTAAATLTKKAFDEMPFDDESWPGSLEKLQFHLQDLRDTLGADKGNLNIEIQRTMDEARRAISEAMRKSADGTDSVRRKLELMQKRLGNFAAGGVSVGKDATVVVKNNGGAIRTMVKKDDSGSYVIVADPAKHLTAHDADGKLLFDGAIETPEDQQKVPKEVWKKVEPMLEDLKKDAPPGGGKSSGGGGSQED